MSLACKISGHRWDGCTCIRCNKVRDADHKWNGCTCVRCGKVREEGHVLARIVAFSERGHYRACSICGRTKFEAHSGQPLPHCRCKCEECGYETTWHEFHNGVCLNCGLDESERYCGLILSGKVRYDAWESSPIDGSKLRYIDHVKSIETLRRIGLTKRKGIYSCCKLACASKLGEIAKAEGADAHDANLALRDLVLDGDLGWSKPMVAQLITDPEISSDPKVEEAVQQARKAGIESNDGTTLAR